MLFDFAEAHIKYGGMGTMLVIKVGVLTPNKLISFRIELFIYLATLLSISEALSFWVILCFIFPPFVGYNLQVSAESANEFGELVADPVTKELLHYTEKPETFVCTECS